MRQETSTTTVKNFFGLVKNRKSEQGMVVHGCNPSTWDTEAGGSLV
jgi:uncharacterized protein (DUF362 family)